VKAHRTDKEVSRLCELAETIVTPDFIISTIGIEYDPAKISARSSAALLAAFIPACAKDVNIPVIEMGGITLIWCSTHFNPVGDQDKTRILRSFAKPAGLLKPAVLTQEFNREFSRGFANYASPVTVFGHQQPRRGLNFEDGLVVFDSGEPELQPGHEPEWLTTYCIPCMSSRSFVDKTWNVFLEETIPQEDVRRYTLAMMANAIAGDPVRAQKILLLIGAAGAGKSTLIEAIAAVIGGHNVMRSDNLAQITKDDSRHRMKLAQATLCVSADASDNLGDKDALKMIVSKEPIIARKLYSEPMEVVPRASLIVASNEAGFTYALSDPGVERRFDIVTFTHAKPENQRDGQLIDRLRDQACQAAIGCSLLDALTKELQKGKGRLTRPEAMVRELEQMRIEGDPIMSWLNDSGIRIEVESGGVVVHQTQALESFRTYCVRSGYTPWSMRKFKARLRALKVKAHGRRGKTHDYEFGLEDVNAAKQAMLIDPFAHAHVN
jgi:P4 family phage/plasmid primase-like protien